MARIPPGRNQDGMEKNNDAAQKRAGRAFGVEGYLGRSSRETFIGTVAVPKGKTAGRVRPRLLLVESAAFRLSRRFRLHFQRGLKGQFFRPRGASSSGWRRGRVGTR